MRQVKGKEYVKDLIDAFLREPDDLDPDQPFIVAHHLGEGGEEEDSYLSIVISSSSIIDKILHNPVEKGLHINFTHWLSTGILTFSQLNITNVTITEKCPPLSRAKREKFPFYIPLTGAPKSATKTTTFERRAKRALNKYTPLSRA